MNIQWKFLLLSIGALAITYPEAQPLFNEFKERVITASTDSAKTAIIDSFVQQAEADSNIPFSEDTFATFFVWNDTIDTATCEPMDAIGLLPMKKIPGTDFLYMHRSYCITSRISYVYNYNEVWANYPQLDLRNPFYTIGNSGSFHSELRMPEYKPPWEVIYNPDVPLGTYHNHTLECPQITNVNSLGISVYTPVGYDTSPDKHYQTQYVTDGDLGTDTLNAYKTPTVMNNLIDSGIAQPIICVYIKASRYRMDFFAGANQLNFENWIVNNLVPFIDANYRTIPSADSRIIHGISIGGVIAAQMIFHSWETFGKAAIVSPTGDLSYQPYMDLILNPKRDVTKIYYDYGIYESAAAVPTKKLILDSLISKGYDVCYNVWCDGHKSYNFRAHNDDIAKCLYPGSNADTNTAVISISSKKQPVGLSTYIRNVSKNNRQITVLTDMLSGQIKITIMTIAGKIVAASNRHVNAGESISISFPRMLPGNGIYLLKIDSHEFSDISRFVF